MLISFFSRENPNFNRNIIIGVAVILMLAAFNFLARFFLDNYHYNAGHNAFITADCETAMSQFDKVIQSNRNSDFGNFKAMSRNQRNDCELFQTAVNAHQAGKLNIAISNYLIYLDRNTTGQYSTLSQKLIADILTRSTLEDLTAGGVCLELEKVLDGEILPPNDPVLPFVIGQCGNFYSTNFDFKTAITMYEMIIENYQDPHLLAKAEDQIFYTHLMHGQLLEIEGKLEASLDIYEMLLEQRPDSKELSDTVPNILFQLGKLHQSTGDREEAIALFERILDEFPQADILQEVKDALVLAKEQDTAYYRDLPTPTRTGTTTQGSTQVIIQNSSPDKLRIIFKGQENRIEELKACSSCKIYSFPLPICPKKGPFGYFTLKPGEYDVVIESVSRPVFAWKGNWHLQSSYEYSYCFFLYRTYP